MTLNLYRVIALSDHPVARATRTAYRTLRRFSLPAPGLIIRPALWLFVGLRSIYYWLLRVCVCEPLFKAYCTSYGRGLMTGVYIHWVQGKGDLVIGDNVKVDGKCSFSFAIRFSERPTLSIGDNAEIEHGCRFTVADRITIGRNCMLSQNVWMFDSSGHPSDPEARVAGLPATLNEVKPITIRDNAWIGGNSIVFPGVTIGEGSVVSAGSVVMTDVPDYTLVAGNPARRVRALTPPAGAPAAAS